jgi:hypothetical protein
MIETSQHASSSSIAPVLWSSTIHHIGYFLWFRRWLPIFLVDPSSHHDLWNFNLKILSGKYDISLFCNPEVLTCWVEYLSLEQLLIFFVFYKQYHPQKTWILCRLKVHFINAFSLISVEKVAHANKFYNMITNFTNTINPLLAKNYTNRKLF